MPPANSLDAVWAYLATSPLLHLTLTLLAYLAADWLFQRSGRKALLNPVLLSILMLVALLMATGIQYPTYFEGAQFIHFLLGPATVALAVPLYRHLNLIRRLWLPILVAIATGALVAASSAVLIAGWLGASRQTLMSLAPKSVTTPVAMGIAEKTGGLPSLTAVLVVLTGVLGAVIGPALLALVGVRDDRARGLALGVSSHGIGTARALQISSLAGAFAALAMGLMALTSSFILPVVLRWVMAS
ncbi:LrgB family protein [Thiorhodovibrio frisius]|uniref:Putative effector of murein hydrolase n=1 Tax=Thiorhodovibrio frisius TaxID=631362 RepID=H8Z521_9GAMM|nr:LrgB family protein [Thiorhodovibrio frisius]EIC20428.1 putative effector of murein hydrolase [Thiorhodovibrio frisius]WPL21171.1 Inner membrane protein YohK [Thiorhodovibrio frisius]